MCMFSRIGVTAPAAIFPLQGFALGEPGGPPSGYFFAPSYIVLCWRGPTKVVFLPLSYMALLDKAGPIC